MNESPARVLLVDDLVANLVALEGVLGRLDCTLVRASSGNEALRLLLKHEFAVIVLDVQMPDMDGFEVARLARMDPTTKEVPIIFVTAMHETEENVFRGYETGAVDLLFKPVNAYVLQSKVQSFLDHYQRRLALERELEAHQRTLADLKSFNYSVAHDLRAPLRALEGYSRILLEEHAAALSGDAKECAERIGGAATRMTQLIDDLLRLSQIGQAAVRPEPLDLAVLASSIDADLRRENPTREVELSMPAAIDAWGDRRLVRIMLDNLLRNAWKFTSKSGRSRIEVGTRDEDGAYFVSDDGAGFDARYVDRLFRPFQRLHSTSEFEGTGIGLAIVRRIVDHHGGRIWAESDVGRGATFLFTLPKGR